jgi:hypothetical protein
MGKHKTAEKLIPDNLNELLELINQSESRDKNEAETRHKIIDFILHGYLS